MVLLIDAWQYGHAYSFCSLVSLFCGLACCCARLHCPCGRRCCSCSSGAANVSRQCVLGPPSGRARFGRGPSCASRPLLRARTCVAISYRTSSKMAFWRTFCRRRVNREVVRAAIGLTTAACWHLSHTWVPFCPDGLLCRKDAKLSIGNFCRQVAQVQLPRAFVAHARQIRRSAFRVFHADAV